MPRRPSNHIDDPRAVGARVHEARRTAGLAQRDLVFDGCSAAYVSRIESGLRRPSLQVLRHFARVLGVSEDYLATGATDLPDTSDPIFEADVALRLDDRERARALYEAAAAAPASAREAARALAGLGRMALEEGDATHAQTLLEEAVDSGALDRLDGAGAAEQLGRSYALQGRFVDAAAVFGRVLNDAHLDGDPVLAQRFTILLANTYVDAGNFGKAEELLASILDDARETLDATARARVYWSQSRLYSSKGDAELAAHFARLTVGTLDHTEHTALAARALLLLAHIENDRGDHERVLSLVEEGLPALQATGATIEETMLLLERARALAALDQAEEAAAIALRVTARLGDARPSSAARAYATAAQVFRQLDDPARALELYELAAELLATDDRHAAEVWTAIGELHEEAGRSDEALAAFKRALSAKPTTAVRR
jgi:tetratricopeptide (TPR) repeat protein